MKNYILFLLFLSAPLAHAERDYSAKLVSRSYPLAGNVEGTWGYSKSLWGSTDKNFFTVTRDCRVLLVPQFSTTQVGWKQKYTPSHWLECIWAVAGVIFGTNSYGFDCNSLTCTGFFNTVYYGAKAYLGVPGGISGFISYEQQLYDPRVSNNRGFASPLYGLVLSPNGEDGV